MPEVKFNKNQKIVTESKRYICVCCDYELAIFAPVRGNTITFNRMFAVSNEPNIDDNFTYRRV